jgi:hypothetical protein
MGQTLFRGLLTGHFETDSSDTNTGDPGCLASVQVDDLAGANSVLKVKLLLPNDVPCPAYAAKLLCYDTTSGSDQSSKRKVIVRRDTDSGQTCLTAVVQPILNGVSKGTWGALTTPVARGGYASLDIYAPISGSATGKLGVFPNVSAGVSTLAIDTPVVLTTRCRISGGPQQYAWVVSPPANSGFTVPGQISSGSGNTYNVNLFENGSTSASTRTVSVKQLQISGSETIPSGTWVVVYQVGSEFFMQTPVWLS